MAVGGTSTCVFKYRTSSREQKEGYSLDAQLRADRDRASANGWRVVREFVVAESAKRGAERKAFNEMFAWVKANAKREKIKAILSHKLDRVCRNMRDAVRLQELEDTCGVLLAFVENQFGPGAAGALSFNVMAAVAQYYSDNLRSEVLKGMDEKVRQGWPTGLAPFGYLNCDDPDEPVQPHPETAKTVARIFELYSAGGHTFESLADQLQREGHRFRPSRGRSRARAGHEAALARPDDIADLLAAELSGLRRERDRLAGELAGLESTQTGDVDGGVEAAVDRLWNLADELTKAPPARLRELVRRMVSRIDLWIGKKQVGPRVEYPLLKGVIDLRPDPVFYSLDSRGDKTAIELFSGSFDNWTNSLIAIAQALAS